MRKVTSNRSDHRFIAESVTSTGVTIQHASEWKPAHWEADPLIQQARQGIEEKITQATALNVGVSPIRVYREQRQTIEVVETYMNRSLYAEYSTGRGR